MKVHVQSVIRHDGPTAYALEHNGGTLVRFWDSGRKARIGTVNGERFHWRDLLRWGAPLALAPQGQMVLHGSCVSHGSSRTGFKPVPRAVAFVGVGGAGKSTLARALEERGWERLADDMIACDAACCIHGQGEAVLHDWIDSHEGGVDSATVLDYRALARRLAETTHVGPVPLAALLFLDESRHAGDSFVARRLSPLDCFCRLRLQGFGGLPCPDAWAHQFRVYGAVAGRVQAGVLQAPAGLDKMQDALPQLEEMLCDWLAEQPAAIV